MRSRTQARARQRAAILAVAAASLLVAAAPAAGYKVCADPGAPCLHEDMAQAALDVLPAGEAKQHLADLRNGAGHEDTYDHIYGYEDAGLFSDSFLTITHFWEADNGEGDPVDLAGPDVGEVFPSTQYPNAMQKARQLWSLAIGAYVNGNGDKAQAYEMLGHVAHLIGDGTIPAHVHNDFHPPFDDDPYEEWMSGDGDGALFTHPVTPDELVDLKNAGPIHIPDGEPDGLEYLMYTTNEIAGFFASADSDGDTVDPKNRVRAELDDMAATIGSPRVEDDIDDNDSGNNDDDGDLSRIRKYSFLRGVRAIAALYQLFDDTVTARPQLVVVWDRLEEDQDHEGVCTGDGCDPDYWAQVDFDGNKIGNRGDRVRDNNDVGSDILRSRNFAFGQTVGATSHVGIELKLWDFDGYTGNPLDPIDDINEDDLSDIDPKDEDDDKTLGLSIDVAKCLRGEPGAIGGEVPGGFSGKCGDEIVTGGDDDTEATKVYFRVYAVKPRPVARVGGPYSTDEGTDVKLDGGASTGDLTTYAWDLDGDGDCDDVANDKTPTFSAVGQDGVTTVKLCVTDDAGLTDSQTTTVTVRNVTPAVSVNAPAPITENNGVTVNGTIADPGWLDALTATVSWGDGAPAQQLAGALENLRPDATLAYTASHTYGDNGTYNGQVCGSDDDAQRCQPFTVTVTNTKPAVVIDLSQAISVNGTPTVLAHAGKPVAFAARATDPGSDDLTLAWRWGDGTPNASTLSLVNPPNPDPVNSPSVQPRDVANPLSHTFGKACTYEAGFTATDDDAGSADQTVSVLIVGNGKPNRGHGYWKQQTKALLTPKGAPAIDAATMTCYLKMVNATSRVFSERTPLTTFAQADAVLNTAGKKAMTEIFDVQLLAVWLNFANGAMEYNRLVDTNADRKPDTKFLDAIAAAENLRLNPATTQAQLEKQKNILQSWTTLP